MGLGVVVRRERERQRRTQQPMGEKALHLMVGNPDDGLGSNCTRNEPGNKKEHSGGSRKASARKMCSQAQRK